MRKKLLSLLLAALMILGLLPAAALAAEGDAAPTVTVGDTSYPVTDTGMTNKNGATIYHTLVPAGTAVVNVDWALLKDNLGKYVQDPSIRCSGWHGKSVTYAGSPVTVSLSGHFDEGNDDESNALNMGNLSAEQIAKFKADASNKMVVMVMRWAGAITDAPAGGVLCIELKPTSGGETGDTTNHAPTLAEGVEESVRKYGFEDIAWELDLSTIFTDADGDKLTYKVSVNGADPVEAAEKYSYVCGTTSVTLTFTANDGKADSDKTYTVTLYSNRKTILLKDSGASEVAAGTAFSLSMYSIFKDPDSTGKSFYYSINGAEKEFFGSGQPNGVAFKRAFEKPGKYKLEFYAQHGPTFIGPYTHTLTVTGEAVTNHKPYILETADYTPREQWTGGGQTYTNWYPDFTKVFADEDGYNTLTITYKDDLDKKFGEYYPSQGYATGAIMRRVGERTVTFRATDPYGEYVDYIVKVTVKEDHKATRKEGALEAYTFEVPFGAAVTLNAADYFQDIDSKDINDVSYCDATTHALYYEPYVYTANNPGADTVLKLVGYSGGDWGYEPITFTFRTIMPTSWPTIDSFSVGTLDGTANEATGTNEGDVTVNGVTITKYDSLRVANGMASAGLILIRVDEDVIAAGRDSYTLSGYSATATASTGATVGKELGADTDLTKASDYRLANAVSVSQTNTDETYSEYTLTTYYDLMVVGSNARPILAAGTVAVTEKVTQDVAWTINLNGLFSDADGDSLTYKVSVNGAEAAAIEGSTYTYTPADGIHKLVFTANDSKVDSTDTYTVTLLTRRSDAKAWPQIFAYNLKTLTVGSGKDKTKYPAGSIPVTPVVVNYDEPLTVDNYTYAGEILLYVNEDYTTTGRGYYQVPKDDVTATYTNGATVTLYGRGNLSFSKWTTPPWVDSYTTYITEDGLTNYYYYVKLLQAETPAFAPSIGNGTAASTTENNVTTFPAGSGTGAPTVTVTAPASGWAAGENTFTVACDKACVVLVKSGETYTKLTAANNGETHSFTANLAEGNEIIVRLKGDVNGDGVVNNTDTIQALAASLKKEKATLTEINAACAKVVGGTAVTNTDVIQIGAVALNKAAFQW